MAVVLIASMLVSFWVGEPSTVVPEETLAQVYEAVNEFGHQAVEFLNECV